MAKFYGKVGFAHSVEIRKGVYDDVITEKDYKGDITRPSVKAQAGDEVNSDFSIGNLFSIILDPYLSENLYALRYITWMGVRWSITKIDIAHPRLNVTVGKVYNGPTN